MNVSLNEIETTVLKAARGAGFAWGMAEEIAYAARWLALRDVDSVGPLAALLDDELHGMDAATCPIRLGVRLADLQALDGACLCIGMLRWPVLLTPFLARVGTATGTPMDVTWADGRMFFGSQLHSGPMGLTPSMSRAAAAAPLVIRTGGQPASGLTIRTPKAGSRPADDAARQRLLTLEKRTYVPAPAQSRESGAGADTSDND